MHYKIKSENIHKALDLLVKEGILEIEETDIPESAPITPDELVQEWNERVAGTDFPECKSLGVGKYLTKFIYSCKHIRTREQWIELIILTLKGNYEFSTWRPSLLWLVDYDNSMKIYNNQYSNPSKKEDEAFWQKLREEHDFN